MKRNRNNRNIRRAAQPLAQTANAAASMVVAKIVEQAADLSRKNIKRWRDALEYALASPNTSRVDLMDIYDDIAMDGHFRSQALLRLASVQNTNFLVRNAATQNADEKWTAFFKSEWLHQLMRIYIESEIFGTTCIEVIADKDKVIILEIPRRNVIPRQKKILLKASMNNSFIIYADKAYANNIVQVGADNNLGLLNDLAPQLIWKRHAQQSWSEFSERFGMPMITVTTNKTNQKDIDYLASRLISLGESMSGVFPVGSAIDVKQPPNTDAYNVYKERIALCNAEISKLLVGGTMVSDDGSSRSQSEVHERNLDDKISQTDKRGFEFFINGAFMNTLRANKIAIPDNMVFAFDSSNEIDIKTLFDIADRLSARYVIPAEWLTKTFNIPIAGERNASEAAAKPAEDKGEAPQDEKKKSYPTADAGGYAADCCGHPVAEDYAADSRFLPLFEKVIEIIYRKAPGASPAQLKKAELTADILGKALAKSWNTADLKYESPDYQACQSMEMNLFAFSAAKSIDELQKLNQALLNDQGRPRSFDEFKKEAMRIQQNYNGAYLATEYQHAIGVGQNAANYFRQMADAKTMPYIRYSTAGDSRVRTQHAILNGKIFRIDDPQIHQIYPPNGWRCRCEFIQHPYRVEDDSVNNAEHAAQSLGPSLPDEFKKNRFAAGEVFANNQMYLKDNLDKELNKLNDLAWKDFGLEENPAATQPLVLNPAQTLDSVKQAFDRAKDDKGNVLYADYNKRKMILGEQNFLKHIGITDGKDKDKYLKEQRHLLVDKISEVIGSPSEVYLQQYAGKAKQQIKYLKHYRDETLVVVAEFDKKVNKNMEVMTWYKNALGNKSRNGWLIKK